MIPFDNASLLFSLLLALVATLVGVVIALRHGNRAGFERGRQSRDIEVATLAGEREALRHELQQAEADKGRVHSLADDLRRQVERLGTERSAFQVRSERVTALETELGQLRMQHEQALQSVAELRARNDSVRQMRTPYYSSRGMAKR